MKDMAIKNKSTGLNISGLIGKVDERSSEKTVELAKKLQHIKEQLAASEAQDMSANRKLETRVKVILGGAILAGSTHDESFNLMLKKLIAAIDRAQDIVALKRYGLIKGEQELVPATDNDVVLDGHDR